MNPDGGVLTVGIWLEIGRWADLRIEGMGRALGALVAALAARPDTQVIVALATWSHEPFLTLLADWHIPASSIEIVPSRLGLPFLASRSRNGLTTVPEIRLLRGMEAPSAAQSHRSARVLSSRGIRRLVESVLDILPRVRQRVRRTLFAVEFTNLARLANRRGVDVWFVPYPGSNNARRLTAPLVVAVPDLLYVDLPDILPAPLVADVDARVRQLVPRAAAVVTYSRFVADRHVHAHLGVDQAKVHVVPHGGFDAAMAFGASPLIDDAGTRARAAAVIRDFVGQPAPCRFESIDYLFVTTQVRPYKNFLNLFKAFALLRSRRFTALKLVITGSLDARLDGAAVREHLVHAGLEADVISMHGLPSEVHAALFRLAALTVVPTLFEGGFPFPFCESLSVNTPVVMSAIPVTLEVVPKDLQPLMVFSPRDVTEMADRIEWALDHRAELLRRQQTLYADLRRRTWAEAGADYRAILWSAAAAARTSP